MDNSVIENYKQMDLKVKEAQQYINTLEGNLIKIADAINKDVIPFAVGINRKTQAITNRLDAYWKSRGQNRHKNEEQKGFGIDTEIIKQELQNQHKEYQYKKFELIHMDSPSEEEPLKLKVGTTLKFKDDCNNTNCFRRENHGFWRRTSRGEISIWLPKNLGQKDNLPQENKGETKEPLSQGNSGEYRTDSQEHRTQGTSHRSSN